MKENMMKEDMMSSDVEIDEIGDTKMGEAKGVMNFPKERARVAQKIMSQQKFKGLPKRWKGRGDYFFETQDDGTIKVTGGDKASSLTGGKSTIVKDKDRIEKIIEAARGGDVIEENVSYDMQGKEQMLQADAQRRANIMGPEGTKQMKEYKEKVSLGESELMEDEGSRTGESSELLLNFGFSEEEIASMDPRLKEKFEENVLKFNEKIGA